MSADDPEVDAEIVPEDDEETWSPDEKRRRLIVECMGSAEIEGYILVQNMQMVFDWMKHGTVAKRPRKSATIAKLKSGEE